MSYSVYSDFDIEQHKQTFIHYLEVIIDENGKIMYAVPSHQEKMIKLACEKLNVARDKLNEMCPEEYYFDLMTWLSKVSGACAVWENQVIGDKFTAKTDKGVADVERQWIVFRGNAKKGRLIEMKENPANTIISENAENPENGLKTLMWGFLMDKGQKENIPALKEYAYDLIKMTTQKPAGMNEKLRAKGHIDWKELDITIMSIVIEATALVLSGRLDELEDTKNDNSSN